MIVCYCGLLGMKAEESTNKIVCLENSKSANNGTLTVDRPTVFQGDARRARPLLPSELLAEDWLRVCSVVGTPACLVFCATKAHIVVSST